jgi:hypothetical protein
VTELCSQVTVKGKPCRKYAVAGSDRCAAHLGRAHRPSVLTPALADNLVTMLRAGNYIEVACRAVGVHRRTLSLWLARGRAGAPGDEVFAELAERVDVALAEGEVRNVAQIAAAARENWQAAAWILERSYPERWGRVSTRFRLPDKPPEELPTTPAAGTGTIDPFLEVDELAAKRSSKTSS